MPAKNILKDYVAEAYYHLYNRGVAKQGIFLDEEDYKKFIGYLKIYLTVPDLQGRTLKVSPSRKLNNYTEKIKLLSYCLMPNHFHLFIWQKGENSITDFMRSLGTKYAGYFNKKYQRIGPVFQGRYKAVMVTTEPQFIYLSKYIHRNPLDILPSRTDLEGYKYSSYQNYLQRFNQTWVNTEEIMSYFSKTNPGESYKKFVEEVDESDILRIKNLTLDIEQ